MDQAIKQKFIDAVGEDKFTDNLIDMVTYDGDASGHTHRPEGAVWPASTEDVVAIMKVAYETETPIVARGAGTGLSGMAVPIRGGLVMDMSRMNKIIKVSIPDRLVKVQPGVVYMDLDRALAPEGFCFPPDPASGKVSTIGGNVGTNAGGVRGAKYGVTRDYVLGLEVVLSDGRVMRTGSQTMKCSSGYDLTKLFVGSEGTLGIITEITLKINPRPKAFATVLAAFPTLQDGARAVTETMHSGVIPSVCELLDNQTIDILNKYNDMGLTPAGSMILAECDGRTQAEADEQLEIVVNVFKRNNPIEVTVAEDQEEAERLWAARKALYGTLAMLKPNLLVEDVAVPMSKLPELMEGIQEIAAKHDIPIVNFGHAGDGNLHPNIVYDPKDKEEVRKIHAAGDDIFRLSCKLGGTLTGEHGIGMSKAKYMTWEHDQVAMEFMAGLKKMFDPKNILNPGKMGLEV